MRSFGPAPRIESSRKIALVGSNSAVRDSRTSDRSAQSRLFFQNGGASQIDLFHEALNHGMEILDLTTVILLLLRIRSAHLEVLGFPIGGAY